MTPGGKGSVKRSTLPPSTGPEPLGAKTVDLTSRPKREAANRLYRRLGFVERDTNVYRYELS